MKRIITSILTLCMVFALSVPAAFAAEANTLDNFQKKATYENQFTDVAADHWAMSTIQTCYEYGLMNGSSTTTFNPAGELTVAEALVMAARVHEIYAVGASSLTNGSPWYQPYVDYALENGIINEGDFENYTAKITRAEMAYIFASALPAEEFAEINYVETLPDVTADTPHVQEIVTLYVSGVLTGADSYGTFYPDRTITRAEAAAIIARVAIPAQRRQVSLLQDWMKGNLLFAVPQDCVYVEAEGQEIFASDTVLIWVADANEGLEGFTVELINVDEMNALLLESGDISDLETELVYYGGVPAYRSVCKMTEEGVAYDCVIVTTIVDGHMYMLFYVVLDETTDLNGLANRLRVYESYVSAPL